MEQNSHLEILEAQIRECYGRVVWTHKTQEKCADILNRKGSFFKITQIILSALTTSGILITVFGKNEMAGIVAAILSTALLALNTYLKNYDLGEIAQKHANSASFLWDVREKYLSLLTDIRSEALGESAIRARRDELQSELLNIYKGSPRTLGKAYSEASKALKTNEELTFCDEEIDAFLPKALRKCS
jgi:hypothetical protein